jgi:hypothetical protein
MDGTALSLRAGSSSMRQSGGPIYFNIALVPVKGKQTAENINQSKGPELVRAFVDE